MQRCILTQGDDGLLAYDGRTWRFYGHHSDGLPASPIQTLMFDREGSLWVGTLGHGASRSLGFGEWEHWTADEGGRRGSKNERTRGGERAGT